MGKAIPGDNEAMGGQLGRDMPYIQVLNGRAQGAIYHKCNRELEQPIPAYQRRAPRIPVGRRAQKGIVPCDPKHHKKMDRADPGLGADIRRTCGNVQWPAVIRFGGGKVRRFGIIHHSAPLHDR